MNLSDIEREYSRIKLSWKYLRGPKQDGLPEYLELAKTAAKLGRRGPCEGV